MVARIEHLLASGTPARRVLGIAFTNKAAGELKERVAALLGRQAAELTMTTFHSLCAAILRCVCGVGVS